MQPSTLFALGPLNSPDAHSFDDRARHLMPDRDDVDRLVIGSFCSIGSGASFIMAGNQGHRHDWVSAIPSLDMADEAAFTGASNGFQQADDLVGLAAVRHSGCDAITLLW
ncbi:MAG: hypothetical protein Marn2KO_00810 [Marinobacter nauticus]